ncbi:ATP-binding protein [Siccirubricoccus sp. KC 17139]|uniref:histidine kinase n=1 Tax=Siccirubricoccus soli TaxID=2899147 RepID=A0ABT1D4C6_9PROT|nr:hybrid sensor histidine kinase/response regulator [Siccirubricoccus soli]MCO6416477.1 ATP-binding protein [Siccirubricoccus soli]MCP2682611.1 ATP-binding protein [Siccirubricoccus soli]
MPREQEASQPMVGGRSHSSGVLQHVPFTLRILLVASLLVPLLVLFGAAFYDHRKLQEQAVADVDRQSAIAKEHALKVVETSALVLDRIEDRVRGMSWAQIDAEGESIQRWMLSLDESVAQMISLHLVRPDGRLALLSIAWPTPDFDLSGRDFFAPLREGAEGLVFGRPQLSRLTGIVGFVAGRRRTTPDGRFDGAVMGSILPAYFRAQWQALDPEGRTDFALLRTDGQILAAYPAGADELFEAPVPGEVPEMVRNPPASGAAIARFGSRGEWLTAFRKVGEHGLVVSATRSMDQVAAEWWRNTAFTAAICSFVALALSLTTLLAIRRWTSEQRIQQRLFQTAAELRAEIARREVAEAGLMQAQRLEALGRLTGGIAHDFNNLLTAILGTVHLLERHIGAAADERVKKLLGAARDAVQRGAKLNASLLAFARRQRLHTESLDANELVQGFVPLIQRALGETVTLSQVLEADLPACRADAAQLEAALLNLAINARDAMPRGGTVTLTTRLARLDQALLIGNPDAQPGDYVAISLRDTGTGMTPEVRERAFEPFFTTKPQGKGTGLGLSQVFGFVRQLGGHVAIDSTPGEGVVVTLYLPVAEEPPARPAAPVPPPPEGMPSLARASILVVEDDERVREVAAETLRDAGFRVVAAQDALEAMALLRRGEQFDVLFSDIVMPGGMTGIELAQQATRLRPTLPVLLATGFAGTVEGGTDHNFEVMPKPYDQAVLVRRIAELAKARGVSVA